MLIRLVIRRIVAFAGQLGCALMLSTAPAGLAVAQDLVDGDADGVPFSIDECPYSRPGELVDARGCTTLRDSDEDGIADIFDNCPLSQIGALINPDGCAVDTDRDGIADGIDQCAGTPTSQAPDATGCSAVQLARQRATASSPEVVVGRPRPSSGRAEVLIDTPQPVRPPQQPVPTRPDLVAQLPAVVAPVSRPAALFSASGRSVEFVAFEALGFGGNAFAGLPPSVSRPVPAIQPQAEFAESLAQSARFAQPEAPRAPPQSTAAAPVAVPSVPVPTNSVSPEIATRPVPNASPSVAAVVLGAPAEAERAVAVEPQAPRDADPAAYSPMARAVANALLGLAPKSSR